MKMTSAPINPGIFAIAYLYSRVVIFINYPSYIVAILTTEGWPERDMCALRNGGEVRQCATGCCKAGVVTA